MAVKMGREISKTVSQTFLNIYCLSFCLFHLHCHTIWFRAIEFSTVGDHWQGMFSGGLQLRHRHSFPRLLYHLYYPFTVFRWFFLCSMCLISFHWQHVEATFSIWHWLKSDKEMGLLTIYIFSESLTVSVEMTKENLWGLAYQVIYYPC